MKVSDGAPEEIRTPDPQIRSLFSFGSLKQLFCKTHHFVNTRKQWLTTRFAKRFRGRFSALC